MVRVLHITWLFLRLLEETASLSPPVIIPAAPPVRTSLPASNVAKAIPALGPDLRPSMSVAVHDATRARLRGSQPPMQAPVAAAIDGHQQAETNRMDNLTWSWPSFENAAPLLSLAALLAAAAASWKAASKRWSLQRSTVLLEMKTLDPAMADQTTYDPHKFPVAALTGVSSFDDARRWKMEETAMHASKQQNVRQDKWIKTRVISAGHCRRTTLASGVRPALLTASARSQRGGRAFVQRRLRIVGREIPRNELVPTALTLSIFGIGRRTGRHICKTVGIELTKRVHELTEEEELRLSEEIGKYTVENALRRMYKANVNQLRDIGHIRGTRMEAGLPVRGQRTKTNRNNARKLNPHRF